MAESKTPGRFILFDLDGTLIDSLGAISFHLNKVLGKHGCSSIPIERVKALIGNSSRYLVDHALNETGCEDLSLEEKENILNEYNGSYYKDPVIKTLVYKGVEDLLKKLKDEGHLLGILSNKPDEIVKNIVQEIFGDNYFDNVRGFREDVPRKPDSASLFAMLEEMNVNPQDVIYVGDSEVDAELGHAAGVRTILVSYGFRTLEELEKEPCEVIVASIEELTNYLEAQAEGV